MICFWDIFSVLQDVRKECGEGGLSSDDNGTVLLESVKFNVEISGFLADLVEAPNGLGGCEAAGESTLQNTVMKGLL